MQTTTRRPWTLICAALLMAAVVGISIICAPAATAEPRQPTLPFGTPWYTVWVNKPNAQPGYVFLHHRNGGRASDPARPLALPTDPTGQHHRRQVRA